MANLSVYNINGEIVKELSLNDEVYNAESNKSVLHDVLVSEMASFRQGSASTKTRAMVRGGGRKPWKQKGTGRARQGSTRAPHWVGGGVVHGPLPRDFFKKVNKKVRKIALRTVLSEKLRANEVFVLENTDLEVPKTKIMLNFFEKMNFNKSTLFVMEDVLFLNRNLYMSMRNIPNSLAIEPWEIGIYWLLRQKHVILTEAAAIYLQEVLA